MTQEYIKSPLRYVGSKLKVLSQIYENTHENILVDVFGGSGVVSLNYDGFAVYNDNNPHLTETLKEIATDADFIKNYVEFANDQGPVTKDVYLERKAIFNQQSDFDPYLFYFLNQYSFSGLVRYNNEGKFTTAYGKNPNRHVQHKAISALQLKYAQGLISFSSLDWQEIMGKTYSSDHVFYCDPPYIAKTNKRLSPIYQNTFTLEDHKLLDLKAYQLAENGAKVLISSEATTEAKEIYCHAKGFQTYNIVRQTNGTKTSSQEMIAIYYPPQ